MESKRKSLIKAENREIVTHPVNPENPVILL